MLFANAYSPPQALDDMLKLHLPFLILKKGAVANYESLNRADSFLPFKRDDKDFCAFLLAGMDVGIEGLSNDDLTLDRSPATVDRRTGRPKNQESLNWLPDAKSSFSILEQKWSLAAETLYGPMPESVIARFRCFRGLVKGDGLRSRSAYARWQFQQYSKDSFGRPVGSQQFRCIGASVTAAISSRSTALVRLQESRFGDKRIEIQVKPGFDLRFVNTEPAFLLGKPSTAGIGAEDHDMKHVYNLSSEPYLKWLIPRLTSFQIGDSGPTCGGAQAGYP